MKFSDIFEYFPVLSGIRFNFYHGILKFVADLQLLYGLIICRFSWNHIFLIASIVASLHTDAMSAQWNLRVIRKRFKVNITIKCVLAVWTFEYLKLESLSEALYRSGGRSFRRRSAGQCIACWSQLLQWCCAFFKPIDLRKHLADNLSETWESDLSSFWAIESISSKKTIHGVPVWLSDVSRMLFAFSTHLLINSALLRL